MNRKPWGGGYARPTSSVIEDFTESISFDHRLAPYDIKLSIAHARMLGRQGIIPASDARRLVKELERLENEVGEGKVRWNSALEDVHMNIEAILTKRLGAAGKRVHTGRSRNDQVATAFRLYCADAAEGLSKRCALLQSAIRRSARRFGSVVLPGYTHLQQAQPVTWRTYCEAYLAMFDRDRGRFRASKERAMEYCPLGAAALAGTSFPLDRRAVARELGFRVPAPNPMDAVSDRDFAVELLAALALCQTHLSRLAEDLVIYSSREFGFVRLDDSVTTGSSIMPQKKNPDVCELARGKCGRVFGSLMALLTVLKGLPMTYNRDLQEDKESVFDAVETVGKSLEAMAECVDGIYVDRERAAAVLGRETLATDIAEYLVAEAGVPFREAHAIVARLVASTDRLERVTEEALREAHPSLSGAKFSISFEEAVRRRGLPGVARKRMMKKEKRRERR